MLPACHKLVLLATCIILAAIIHAASLANIQLNYEPATWQYIRALFPSPYFSLSPFITSFCLLCQLSTVMRAVFIATVFLSLFLPFSFSSSSTADCHFALRAAILLCIFHMRLSCGSSVSSAFPAAVDIVVYLFTALPPLPLSLSPPCIYVSLFLFVFCCVCSVCAIECNK